MTALPAGYERVEKDGKIGVADNDGRVMIPAQYDSVGHLSGPFFWVGLNKGKTGKFGVWSTKTGELVRKPLWDDIDFELGFVAFVRERTPYSPNGGGGVPKIRQGKEKEDFLVVPLASL